MPTSAADTEIAYTGNGVTVAYPFPFEVAKAAHFEATIDGVVVTDYTLSGLGVDTGGTCTFTTAPASLAEIVLARVAPYARTDFDYQEGGELAANTLDEDVDRTVQLSQQLATMLKRVPKVKRGDLTKSLDLVPEAGSLLGWSGSSLANVAPSTLSPSIVPVSALAQTFLAAATTNDERILMGANFAGPSNVALSVSASAGALTIALKGDDGSDHSASNPGYISTYVPQNDSTKMRALAITSAQSVTIPSTATLGALANLPFRVWVAVVNNNGTLRLAVINSVTAAAGFPHAVDFSVAKLPGFGITELKADLDTASDSGGIFYFTGGGAGAQRVYSLLGYIDFEAGLAVPGTWVAPSGVYLWRPGMPTPGDVISTWGKRLNAVATGTTPLPVDDTVPTSTEGDAFITIGNAVADYLPYNSPCNAVAVDAIGHFASSNTDNVIAAALFLNTDAAACAAAVGSRPATAGARCQVAVNYFGPNIDAAGQVLATVAMRAGTNSAGTTTFNGTAGARTFGGRMASQLIAREIMT